eukprot:scaffold795_cov375-Prasinococcus_capsulatus_cf.AAC.39
MLGAPRPVCSRQQRSQTRPPRGRVEGVPSTPSMSPAKHRAEAGAGLGWDRARATRPPAEHPSCAAWGGVPTWMSPGCHRLSCNDVHRAQRSDGREMPPGESDPTLNADEGDRGGLM